MADQPEREIVNMADPHVKGENVIHCVVDPKVIEM